MTMQTCKQCRYFQPDPATPTTGQCYGMPGPTRSTGTMRQECAFYKPASKSTQPTKAFHRPTSSEIEAYGREIGFPIEGQAFLDHYEARGWKYGVGRPVVDWKAAVRTWKRNAGGGGAGGNGAGVARKPGIEAIKQQIAACRAQLDIWRPRQKVYDDKAGGWRTNHEAVAKVAEIEASLKAAEEAKMELVQPKGTT